MKMGERGKGEGWKFEVRGRKRVGVEPAGQVIGLQKNGKHVKQEVESGTLMFERTTSTVSACGRGKASN